MNMSLAEKTHRTFERSKEGERELYLIPLFPFNIASCKGYGSGNCYLLPEKNRSEPVGYIVAQKHKPFQPSTYKK